ncbi:hypothetical protein [Paenibacillus polymyxa]|uniref:hypothetical protein n=1 Tax=Paenibacillus polymyxa TaxID=1406 RepID=UPI0004DF5F41|nr:hypothetical protein [Paenibacillus polymyxa]KJD38105.1 hypothetical protein QD46_21565 [Paenibacillus polymyxa]MBE3650788.1 hypothetical protein [Paenibacillus polymyxa]MBY7740292.1 hypothetical protein [Paenibacillus polymyxa]MEE4580990.1 hypothetical protein [Paenibacillus polymyxa]RPE03346.1 hypothetical protein EG487_14275 [Paenibacillus polymyxa]
MIIFKEKVSSKDQYEQLLNKMSQIVDGMITKEKFRADFYKSDTDSIKQYNTFAWFVYDYGTHLFPLDSVETIRDFQQNWLETLHEDLGEANTFLFVCNRTTGEIKPINHHKNVVEQLQCYVAV